MTTLRFSLSKFLLSKFALILMAFCLLLLGAIGGAGAQTTWTTTWNPTTAQVAEPDTLYFMNAATEASDIPGAGGWMRSDTFATSTVPSVAAVAGPFTRQGYQSSAATPAGVIFRPVDGILPADQFTIEFQTKFSVDWHTLPNTTRLFTINTTTDSVSMGCSLSTSGAYTTLYWTMTNNQGTWPASGNPGYLTGSADVTGLLANTWQSFAFVLKNGQPFVYLNGVEKTQARSPSNLALNPFLWASLPTAGLTLCGGSDGNGQTGEQISDFRISRYARVLGTNTYPLGNALTVTPATKTGSAVNYNLIGAQHYVQDGINAYGSYTSTFPNGTTYTENTLKPVLRTIEIGHFLNAITIGSVAGGAAVNGTDAATGNTYTSAGASGQFVYNWGPVDHEMNYIVKVLGLTPYFHLECTPYLLSPQTAGYAKPFSGTDLIAKEPWRSQFGSGEGPPNNFTSYATIISDLLHHLRDDLGYTLPKYMAIWNEPDGGSFWTGPYDGSATGYFTLYKSVANAIKSVDSTIKVGPGGIVAVSSFLTWCGANTAPVDFVEMHDYTGNATWALANVYYNNKLALAALGHTVEFTLGESNFAQNAQYGAGFGITDYNDKMQYELGDYSAAFLATKMILLQKSGVSSHFTGVLTGPTGLSGFGGYGLFAPGPVNVTAPTNAYANTSNHPWSPGNTYRLYAKIAPTVVSAAYSGTPVISYLASTDTGGRVTVLISSLSYTNQAAAPLAIKMPVSYAGWAVNDYIIDASHANYLQAGPDKADLLPLKSVLAGDGSTSVLLTARCVHLVEITPPLSHSRSQGSPRPGTRATY